MKRVRMCGIIDNSDWHLIPREPEKCQALPDRNNHISAISSGDVRLLACELDGAAHVMEWGGSKPCFFIYLGFEGTICAGTDNNLLALFPDRLELFSASTRFTISTEGTARFIIAVLPASAIPLPVAERVVAHSERLQQPANMLVTKLLRLSLTAMAENATHGDHPHLAAKIEILLALIKRIQVNPALIGVEQHGQVPWYITLAEGYISEHLEESLCLEDLARVTGMSSRTLHDAFRKYRGYSPMKFIREQRMNPIRMELTEPLRNTTVTDVALKWGFNHLGRFSSYYFIYFGEKPSTTLHRSR